MKDKLNLELFYPHPPERVWQALTDPDALAKWLLPTDFKPTAGRKFKFQGSPRGSDVHGEVLEVEESRRLTYTWDDGGDDGEAGSASIVEWKLEPVDGGTRVHLEHRTLEAASSYVLIEANLNWSALLHLPLPIALRILQAQSRPPVPIVYVQEEPTEEPKRRAGFRQEEPVCS